MKTLMKINVVGALVLLMLSVPAAAQDPSRHLSRNLDFCGERVDLNDDGTYESIDQSLVLLAEGRSRVFLAMRRAGRYLPVVEAGLRQAGLPGDLKYIPYALTGFDPYNSAGGRGLWRLKEGEARNMGLRVDGGVDERLDPVASTEAAAKRLSQLKNNYGSWTMAAAAFVIGDDVIRRAVTDAGGENDYYKLFIPGGQEQTFSQVLAGKIVFGNPGAFGYSLSGSAWPAMSGKRVVVSQAMSVRALAAQYGVDYKSFGDANPHLVGATAPAGVRINLP